MLAFVNGLFPYSALADGPRKVLVLRPQSDSLPEADKEAALTVVRDALAKYPGVTLLETPTLDLLDVMMELECTDVDDDCFTRIGKKFAAATVVYTDIAPDGAGYAVTMRTHNVAKKTSGAPYTAKATAKGDLASAVGGGVVAGFGKLPEPKPPKEPPPPKEVEKQMIEFRSTPAGATVVLNGVKLGTTPVTVRLKPGKYKATVTLDGHTPIEAHDVEVKATEASVADFALTAVAVETPPIEDPGTARPFYKTWWFWTAIGVAVVGTTVGLAVGLSGDDEPAPQGILDFGFGAPDVDPAVRSANQ